MYVTWDNNNVSDQSGAARQYPRSAGGLIGSIIVVVAVVIAFVIFRDFFSKDLNVEQSPVDYLEAVGAAQGVGQQVAYPTSLPAGWRATSVDYDPTDGLTWGIGILTDDDQFVGIRQEDGPVADLLTTYVDENPVAGKDVEVPSAIASTWQTWTDTGGDQAYAADLADQTVLVYGSASTADQRELLGLLSADELPGQTPQSAPPQSPSGS